VAASGGAPDWAAILIVKIVPAASPAPQCDRRRERWASCLGGAHEGPLKIPCDRAQFGAVGLGRIRIEAVIEMIVDQRPLGIRDGVLDRLHLLGDVEARPARLDHLDHGAQMTVGAFQPGDQRGVACMSMRI